MQYISHDGRPCRRTQAGRETLNMILGTIPSFLIPFEPDPVDPVEPDDPVDLLDPFIPLATPTPCPTPSEIVISFGAVGTVGPVETGTFKVEIESGVASCVTVESPFDPCNSPRTNLAAFKSSSEG